jgi:thiamine-phosphate pyrophosphorylase
MPSESHRVPRLFCLVDATRDLALLPALVDAGVDGFQVRAKALTDAALLDFTRRVIVAASGTTVVVNDRVDIALASGADGVHLGTDDLPVAEARRLAPGLLIGGTCRSRDAAIAARDAGADYAGFGPISSTTSKTGLPEPLGVDALGIAADVLPLIAIGGISATSAADVIRAGAHGIAVIGAIWNAADPVAAAAAMSASLMGVTV